MTTSAERYADWKAPKADGEVLLWPEAGELVLQTRENGKSLADAGRSVVQGVPLPELRRRMREFIGHDAVPLIATGHQTELYHPGVWAKNVLINRIAGAVGG